MKPIATISRHSRSGADAVRPKIGFDIEIPVVDKDTGRAYPATLFLPHKDLRHAFANPMMCAYPNAVPAEETLAARLAHDLRFRNPTDVYRDNVYGFDHDGLPAEIQLPPETCAAYMIDHLRAALARLDGVAKKHNSNLMVLPSAGAPPITEMLNAAPAETFVSGCNMTFDAFAYGQPITPDPEFGRFVWEHGCYTGTHIHFGLATWVFALQSRFHTSTREYVQARNNEFLVPGISHLDRRLENIIYENTATAFARILSRTLLPIFRVICLHLDRNGYEAIRATKVPPGSFRPKPYGFEYKDISSNIVAHHALFGAYAAACRQVVASVCAIVLDGMDKLPLAQVLTDDVAELAQHVIRSVNDIDEQLEALLPSHTLIPVMRDSVVPALVGMLPVVKSVLYDHLKVAHCMDYSSPFTNKPEKVIFELAEGKPELLKLFAYHADNSWDMPVDFRHGFYCVHKYGYQTFLRLHDYS